MTPWQDFYNTVRDPSWPDCDSEDDFIFLPDDIRKECQDQHGYVLGQYRSQSSLLQKQFPIKTATACQLKWTWSTVFLSTEKTASCHRTNQHDFDIDKFDFHNTPEKIQDRTRMLTGNWPSKGCEYCKDIEQAGGQSDRITNLNLAGIHAPAELSQDVNATVVTPRILEVYFNNTCNLKCVYCGSHFSSLWDAENTKFGKFEKNGVILPGKFQKSTRIQENTKRLFEWLKQHGHHLTGFNILGGEPLYQEEFDQCLDFFNTYPLPELDLQIFSNLNVSPKKIKEVIEKVRTLKSKNKIKNFTVTASLDCWGKPQEYARYPLDLQIWEKNFEMLLDEDWIKLIIGSTITPLTVKTLPDLIEKIAVWNQKRPVYHYFNSVNNPSYLFIDIFGDLFQCDFQKAIDLYSFACSTDQQQVIDYLRGIASESSSKGINKTEILKLNTFLDEMDRRRNTDWRTVFSWLVDPIESILFN